MNLSQAWLDQAYSDRAAAERALKQEDPSTYCQTIAKCQQTFEKGIKALVAALTERGYPKNIGFGHSTEHYLSFLRKLPGRPDQNAVAAINAAITVRFLSKARALDAVVPKRPAPGQEPKRNTEYPFKSDGQWRAPANAGVFALREAREFLGALDTLDGLARSVSAIRKLPKSET